MNQPGSDPNLSAQEAGSQQRIEQLQASIEELDRIFRLSPDMLCIASRDGRLLRVNPAWEQTLGYRADELVGRSVAELVHPDSLAATEQAIAELQAGKPVADFVNRYRHRDGSYRWFEWHAVPYGDGQVYAVARDITKRKQTEQALQEVISSARDGILVYDRHMRFQLWNPAMESFSGVPAKDVLGRYAPDVFPFLRGTPALERFERAMQGEASGPTEFPYSIPSTNRSGWVAEMNAPLRNAEGEIVGVIDTVRDITAEKLARKSLELTRFTIEHSGDAVFWMTPDARVADVNEAACRSLGYSREELLSLTIYDIDPLQTPEIWAQGFDELRRVGDRVLQTSHRTKDGLVKNVEISANYVQHAGQEYSCAFARDITERKLIEETLRFLVECGSSPGEDFFQSLARYLAKSLKMDYVCIGCVCPDECSAQTLAVYCDGKFEENSSYLFKDTPCGEVVGKTTCCFPSGVRERFPSDVVLEQIGAESYLGTSLWSSQGRPIGVIAVIGRRKITDEKLAATILHLTAVRAAGELERRQAEQSLRESHEKTAGILASISDAFFSMDDQLVVTYFNEAAERTLNRRRDEVIGRYLFDAFPEARGSLFEHFYLKAIAEKRPMSVETYFDVAPYRNWYDVRVYPQAEGVSVYFQVITARKEAEQALQAANQELQAINHAVEVCAASLDMQTILERLLDEALAVTGLEGGTICMVGPDNTLRLAAHRATTAATIADLTQNMVRVGECLCGNCARECRPLILPNRDAVLVYATREATRGELIHFHAAFPIMGQSTCLGVLCVFTRTDKKPHDHSLKLLEKITAQISLVVQKAQLLEELERELAERRRAEEAERTARALAESASRAKDQFMAVLSHELRTPLTPVLAQVEMLRRLPGLLPEISGALEMIERNVGLESRLIADLLDMTRISRNELRLEKVATDVHETIREAVEICRPQISDKQHKVTLDLRAERHSLLADPGRLRQVFWNLLGNAVKYTPEGGRIEVRSSNTPGGGLQVELRDSGIGIAAEVMEKLFLPFVQGEQTLSRRFGGLGLGLSIAKGLVEGHGGRLSVASEGPGQGATFTVDLPLPAEALPKRPKPLPVAAEAAGPARILLVEDNQDTLKVLARVLRQQGNEVNTAASVQAALGVAATWEFDLLLCDIGLPDGTGWDLLRQLRTPQRDIKALALSGFATQEDVDKSLAAGFREHLTKPLNLSQLQRSIACAMASPATH